LTQRKLLKLSLLALRTSFVVISIFSLGYISFNLQSKGYRSLAIIFGFVVLLLIIIYSFKKLYPLRWLAPGIALLIIFFLYPAINTGLLSTTNFGSKHLLSKTQAIERIQEIESKSDGQSNYSYYTYATESGKLGLLLLGPNRFDWATTDSVVSSPAPLPRVGNVAPKKLGEYTLLDENQTIENLQALSSGNFTNLSAETVKVTSLSEATAFKLAYVYNSKKDYFTSLDTGERFTLEDGTYISKSRKKLTPGFKANIGMQNFFSVVTNPLVSKPFFRVLLWNLTFALLGTFFAFALGFLIALIVNGGGRYMRRFYRTGYLLPYILPIFITAPVWVGLLNPVYGPVNNLLDHFIGIQPDWFGSVLLSRSMLLIISLWLGFPFAMLVCISALQSIPRDLFEAVAVDGGSKSVAVKFISFPWVLSSIAPIMVGAFAFNFNSFAIIELVTKGGPPDLASASPAGYTDILLSYTYRLAFTNGLGLDYGLAAAISFLIFFITALLSIMNFKVANRLKIT